MRAEFDEKKRRKEKEIWRFFFPFQKGNVPNFDFFGILAK